MSDSLEEGLKEILVDIENLRRQISRLESDITGTATGDQESRDKFARQIEDLRFRLGDARQIQLSILLTSISESSIRLEVASKNLKGAADSQTKTLGRLLRSSNRLEWLTQALIVLTFVNAYLVLATQNWLSLQWKIFLIIATIALPILLRLFTRLSDQLLD